MGTVKVGKAKVKHRFTAKVRGEKYSIILHELPGRGKLDKKTIRAAVKKVRDSRINKEKVGHSE
jgi:hypothetical protein